MAAFTVFYSWQSDLPRKVTRDLIHAAAQTAIDRISNDIDLLDAPRLDHDTQGVSGVPAIGETILKKIDKCGIFLADVSFVGASNDKGKKLSNPNVLLELGYAAAKIGWDRIIPIMNTRYGGPRKLPFDLRYRRYPISFDTSEKKQCIEEDILDLSNEIESFIRSGMNSEHEGVTDVLGKLDGASRYLMNRHGTNTHFWETEITDGHLVNEMSLAKRRLLELGIIECVPFKNKVGHAYSWTYIGRLCLRRLGFGEPPIPAEVFSAESVIMDVSSYDSLIETLDGQVALVIPE